MLESIKPGQKITCTINKVPHTDDREQTILRLMRKDAKIVRALRRSQMLRRRHMVVYNRGNRDWYKRANCGKIAHVVKDATWTMHYTPDLAADFNAVSEYISVKAG